MKVYRDPLQKCNNPGGDCYWEGGQPKIDLFTLQYHFPLLPWIYSVVTYIHQWSSIHVSRSTCGNVSLWMIKYVMVGHFCYIFKLTTDPTSQQFRLSEQVSFSGLAKQTGDVNLPDWFCPSKRFSASMQQPFFSTYGFLAMNKPTSSGNVSTNDWITVYQLAASKKSSLKSMHIMFGTTNLSTCFCGSPADSSIWKTQNPQPMVFSLSGCALKQKKPNITSTNRSEHQKIFEATTLINRVLFGLDEGFLVKKYTFYPHGPTWNWSEIFCFSNPFNIF